MKVNSITTTPLSHFEKRLPFIKKFIVREGHAQIPLAHQEDGQPIGYWCSNWRFRAEAAMESIPLEQLEALRAIGMLDGENVQPPAIELPAPQSEVEISIEPLVELAKLPQEEAAISIPLDWMQKSVKQEAKECEGWTLPVNQLRQSTKGLLAPKVVVKKRRWLHALQKATDRPNLAAC